MARTRGEEKRDKYWAMRLTEAEYVQISARAQQQDLSMTEYLVRCALGELDAEPASVDQHFEEIERRLSRLEEMAGLGSYG